MKQNHRISPGRVARFFTQERFGGSHPGMAGASWPSFYPRECCPPTEAKPPSGPVFRIVKKCPPTDGDFKPDILNPQSSHVGKDPCQRAGLSVYDSLERAKVARERVSAFRNRAIAVCIDAPGVWKSTPGLPGHHTWWTPADTNNVTIFRCVETSNG